MNRASHEPTMSLSKYSTAASATPTFISWKILDSRNINEAYEPTKRGEVR
jgi:hypothetical protein